MRILALNWRDIASPEAGGAEIHLHEILKRLVAQGHEATLIASQFRGTPGPKTEVSDGIRVFRVGRWWNAHLTVPRAAQNLLAAEPFDVLLDDVNKIPFFAPRWSPIPVVALFHHLLGTSVFLETNALFAAMIWLYERGIPAVYRETRSIVISPSTLSELVAAGMAGERCAVIPPGIDLPLHRADICTIDEEPLLLVVSRLRRYKRVDVVIRALSLIRQSHPSARLAVIGTGPERPRLEALARRIDQPVTFLGKVTDAEKVTWLNRAHLLLNPSLKEGWGMVATEAMASGTVPVVSDVAGHRDSVPGHCGVRVPYGDVPALADAVLDLLRDPVTYRRLRYRGLAWAQRFGWESCAHDVEDVLARAAGQVTAERSLQEAHS